MWIIRDRNVEFKSKNGIGSGRFREVQEDREGERVGEGAEAESRKKKDKGAEPSS